MIKETTVKLQKICHEGVHEEGLEDGQNIAVYFDDGTVEIMEYQSDDMFFDSVHKKGRKGPLGIPVSFTATHLCVIKVELETESRFGIPL